MNNKFLSTISILVFLSALIIGACKTRCKNQNSTFKLVYTRSYCGGARPTEEMLSALRTPVALSNCKINFVNEKNGRTTESLSNLKGEVNVSLEPGNYFVRIADNTSIQSDLPFKKDCKKLSEINLSSLQIPATTTDSIFIKIPCDPCDSLLKNRR